MRNRYFRFLIQVEHDYLTIWICNNKNEFEPRLSGTFLKQAIVVEFKHAKTNRSFEIALVQRNQLSYTEIALIILGYTFIFVAA